RGGGVEDDDAQLSGLGFSGEVGPGEGKDGEGEQDDLQDQEPVLAEFLEWRAGLGFGQKLLPEQRAGDEFDDALALEQVKDDDNRNRSGEQESEWSEEVHARRESEIRMSKSERNPDSKTQNQRSQVWRSSFGFLVSFVIWNLSFAIAQPHTS